MRGVAGADNAYHMAGIEIAPSFHIEQHGSILTLQQPLRIPAVGKPKCVNVMLSDKIKLLAGFFEQFRAIRFGEMCGVHPGHADALPQVHREKIMRRADQLEQP